jgi:hypothetical protein
MNAVLDPTSNNPPWTASRYHSIHQIPRAGHLAFDHVEQEDHYCRSLHIVALAVDVLLQLTSGLVFPWPGRKGETSQSYHLSVMPRYAALMTAKFAETYESEAHCNADGSMKYGVFGWPPMRS